MKNRKTSRRQSAATAAFFAVLCLGSWSPEAWAYGKKGHQTVGAVADQLIKGSNAETHVKALLGTESLEHASTWADEVKHGPFTAETKAFGKRNKANHAYHYTDIPLQETSYSKTSVGADPNDVVQTINVCIKVLESGTDSATMTQVEALKVLVHLVGDVHQPLHVGSIYLDKAGKEVLPKNAAEVKATTTLGGNTVAFHDNLHAFWDDTSVERAMALAKAKTPAAYAAKLTAKEPVGWKPGAFVSQWGTRWANEMLPLARKAYADLTISPQVSKAVVDHGVHKTALVWPATTADSKAYNQWSAQTVNDCLARGGYRLAALLKKIWP